MMLKGKNKVFIATSLDGYIADAAGQVGFLDTFPMPEGDDMGYYAFISGIDALLMGRKSFETVTGFGVEWPYTKPVFVWTSTLHEVPEQLASKVTLVSGSLEEVLQAIYAKGFLNLYIDGGQVIQSFLRENLIDEMTITTIPVLLGSGVPLFGHVNHMLKFQCLSSQVYDTGLVQCKFVLSSEARNQF